MSSSSIWCNICVFFIGGQGPPHSIYLPFTNVFFIHIFECLRVGNIENGVQLELCVHTALYDCLPNFGAPFIKANACLWGLPPCLNSTVQEQFQVSKW